MRSRERERERVRFKDQSVERGRASSKGNFRWVGPGNTGRNQQNNISNLRDKKDISSFYFTRFSNDTMKKELWHHFRKWGDVREIFIPNRRNINGKRYEFVRFKRHSPLGKTARQYHHRGVEDICQHP